MFQRGDRSSHFEPQQRSIPEWNVIVENTNLQEAVSLQAPACEYRSCVASSRKESAKRALRSLEIDNPIKPGDEAAHCGELPNLQMPFSSMNGYLWM